MCLRTSYRSNHLLHDMQSAYLIRDSLFIPSANAFFGLLVYQLRILGHSTFFSQAEFNSGEATFWGKARIRVVVVVLTPQWPSTNWASYFTSVHFTRFFFCLVTSDCENISRKIRLAIKEEAEKKFLAHIFSSFAGEENFSVDRRLTDVI